ncbi:HEAT repeat domain-containing protein [Kitasatospora sp. NPDC056651]|uniref:HEAT repeat domain-containing protein n=1 Tax=Kitasatospora sp. NPDC056651 TaxID=3345892 RepID=UPI003696726F
MLSGRPGVGPVEKARDGLRDDARLFGLDEVSYSPQVKGTIEALNDAVQEMFLVSLPRYTHRPKPTGGRSAGPDAPPPTFAPFVTLLLERVRWWNTEHHPAALGGLTPSKPGWRTLRRELSEAGCRIPAMSSHEISATADPDPAAMLHRTDWAALAHAYGPAATTADDLLGLLEDDPEVQAASLGRLEMSVLHQGSLYSATAPAALFIAGVLPHPRTLAVHESFFPWDDRTRPLRAALLEWLGQFAESAAFDDEALADPQDAEEAEASEAVHACRAVRPQIFDAIAPFLDDRDETVREAALGAVTHLLAADDLADRIPVAAGRLERLACGGGGRRERAGALLTLARWGRDTATLLTDEDPAVRTCAALGTADPSAIDVLLAELADPVAVDGWFDEPLPQVDGWFRFTVLRGLLERAESFEQVLPVALALIPLCSQYSVDRDWGPLLACAFPEPHPAGAALTRAQSVFLTALLERDSCWGPIANRILWLRGAGLPVERGELRVLVRTAGE